MNWLAWVSGGACVLLIVQIGLLWKNLSVTRSLRRADQRLTQLGDALALLTETSEVGFRTMATEIERLAEAGPRRRDPRVNVARLAAAVRRGRPLSEVAAAEGLSEGEVALRLHLIEQRPPRTDARTKRGSKGIGDGPVRAD
jgi:hypothetical protein